MESTFKSSDAVEVDLGWMAFTKLLSITGASKIPELSLSRKTTRKSRGNGMGPTAATVPLLPRGF